MKKVLNISYKPKISYSQNKEDIILASLFPDVTDGTYVDIGAAHPEYLSVTKHFYTKGWSGINIEPSKRLHRLLERGRPRDRSIQAAISNSSSTKLKFREYLGDGFSTVLHDQAQKVGGGLLTDYYVDYEVDARTLQSVMDESDMKMIHFMNVDVSGYEAEVIRSYDWKKIRPRIVCLNFGNATSREPQKLLTKMKYELFFHDGLNDYFYDTAYYEEHAPVVNYGMIFSPEIISPLWSSVINNQRQELELLDSDVQRLQAEMENAITDPTKLRFRTIGKASAKKLDEYLIGRLSPRAYRRKRTPVDRAKNVALFMYKGGRKVAKQAVKRIRP